MQLSGGGGGGGGGALPMQGVSTTASASPLSSLPSPAASSFATSASSTAPSPSFSSPTAVSAAAPQLPPPSSAASTAGGSGVVSGVVSSSPSDLRASLLCLARTAERAERWDDVCRFMKELIKLTPIQHTQQHTHAHMHSMQAQAGGVVDYDLTDDERHLLVLGYKQVIGQQRSAWKTLRQIQQSHLAVQQQHQQQHQQLAAAAAASTVSASSVSSSPPSSLSASSSSADGGFVELAEDYRQQVEQELHLQCSEIIHLIESILLKQSHKPEAKVFYYKMCGDYYRYLSELVLARVGFSPAGCPGGYDKKAHELYSMAYKLAAASLPSNHPTRLAAALNLSVCLWEVLRERKAACEVAKAAFDGAIAKLEELPEASYKDATLIMQLLRDNLTLWTTAQQNPTQPQTQPPTSSH